MTDSADISRIELMLAGIRQDNAEFKAQIIKDNADFKESVSARLDAFEGKINTRLDAFESKNNARLDAFENKINTRLDKLEAQISVLHDDNIGLKHDVSGLYNWDYWLLSIILVVFAMPQIVAGIKSLFDAITDGIAGIISLFRK